MGGDSLNVELHLLRLIECEADFRIQVLKVLIIFMSRENDGNLAIWTTTVSWNVQENTIDVDVVFPNVTIMNLLNGRSHSRP
jgi:hypothetical protein